MSSGGNPRPRGPRDPLLRAVYAVSLGCPKNRVDTEVMLGDLLSHGYALTMRPENADVVLVNTCGFLHDARNESIEVLREMSRRMRPGARLVAAGCMTEVFRDLLAEQVPELDLAIGVKDLLRLRGFLQGDDTGPREPPSAENPRLLTSDPLTAYLKIADGCSRRCAFCIIPRLRGRQRSRAVDDILAEARILQARGVRELNLVAQDLTHYGRDLRDRPTLATLLRRLSDEAPRVRWIRLLYLYPRDLDDGLLDGIATSPNVLRYLDLPVQHADDRVLAAMRRGTTRRALERLVARIRSRIPGVVLRTTYLVGFPGETDRAFENLLAFARQMRFEMAGVFRFSAEPGSRAAALPDQVPAAVARERERRLVAVLGEIAHDLRQRLIGEVHEALVLRESAAQGAPVARARLWFQAPEVDGQTRVRGAGLRAGDFVQVRITGVHGNDFEGVAVGRRR